MMGFEIVMAVTVKITVFWDVMLCCLIDLHQHFRGTCCLKMEAESAYTWTLKREAA
jgi:hypothetical protein